MFRKPVLCLSLVALMCGLAAATEPPASTIRHPFRQLTHGYPVQAGPLLEDGKSLVVATKDGQMLLIDTSNGRIIREFLPPSAHNDAYYGIFSYTFSEEKKLLYAHGYDGTDLWNYENGNYLGRLPVALFGESFVEAPDGTWAVYDGSFTVDFLDPNTGESVRRVSSLISGFQSEVVIGPRAKHLVAVDRYVGLRVPLTDLDTGDVLFDLGESIPTAETILRSVFAPDGGSVAVLSNKAIRIFDVDTGKRLKTIFLDFIPDYLELWDKYGMVISERNADSIILMDPAKPDDYTRIPFAPGFGWVEGRSKDGSKLLLTQRRVTRDETVTGSDQPTSYHVYDVPQRRDVGSVLGHSAYARELKLASDDSFLALLDEGAEVGVWTTGGERLAQWQPMDLRQYMNGSEGFTSTLDLSADGKRIVTIGSLEYWVGDDTLRVWDSLNGHKLDELVVPNSDYYFPERISRGLSASGRYFGYEGFDTYIVDLQTMDIAARYDWDEIELLGLTGSSTTADEMIFHWGYDWILGGIPDEGLFVAPVADLDEAQPLIPDLDEAVQSLVISPNRNVLAAIPQVTGAIFIHERATGETRRIEDEAIVRLFGFGNDNRSLFVGTYYEQPGTYIRTEILDIVTGQRTSLSGSSWWDGAALSSDGKWIYTMPYHLHQWAASAQVCLDECDPFTEDSDEDGLTDCQENCLGTNPLATDTDGDFIPDGDEWLQGRDPLVAEQGADSDGDGLIDDVEAYLGTNPASADSDSDGMSDFAEMMNGLDPLRDDAAEDLDQDGFTNAFELEIGSRANDALYPPRRVFVSPVHGDDVRGDGVSAPWKTVAKAVDYTRPYAPQRPVTITSWDDLSESIHLHEGMTLQTSGTLRPSGNGVPTVTMESRTGLRNAKLVADLPATSAAPFILVNGGDVRIENVRLQAAPEVQAIGIVIDTQSTERVDLLGMTFEGLLNAVDIVLGNVNVARSSFSSISSDAIIMRAPGNSSEFPALTLGDANDFLGTGLNRFRAVDGAFVGVEQGWAGNILAQNNDWGLYNDVALDARLGDLLYQPFLIDGMKGITAVFRLVDLSTGNAVPAISQASAEYLGEERFANAAGVIVISEVSLLDLKLSLAASGYESRDAFISWKNMSSGVLVNEYTLVPDGFVPEGEEATEGQLEGGIEGEGATEGMLEGSIEGVAEGATEGSPAEAEDAEGEGEIEGLPEGFIEGASEGHSEGASEGVTEGSTEEGGVDGEAESGEGEGVNEGMAEGDAEGGLEGEGSPSEGAVDGEGATEGADEGESEGAPDGEGALEGLVEEGEIEGSATDLAALAQDLFDNLTELDTDRDGSLSAEELSAAGITLSGADFAALDSNADGKISLSELEAAGATASGFGCQCSAESVQQGARKLWGDYFTLAMAMLVLAATSRGFRQY